MSGVSVGGVFGGVRSVRRLVAATASLGSMRPESVSAGCAAACTLSQRSEAHPRRLARTGCLSEEARSQGAEAGCMSRTHFLYGSEVAARHGSVTVNDMKLIGC